jgi:hypothetical protein
LPSFSFGDERGMGDEKPKALIADTKSMTAPFRRPSHVARRASHEATADGSRRWRRETASLRIDRAAHASPIVPAFECAPRGFSTTDAKKKVSREGVTAQLKP